MHFQLHLIGKRSDIGEIALTKIDKYKQNGLVTPYSSGLHWNLFCKRATCLQKSNFFAKEQLGCIDERNKNPILRFFGNTQLTQCSSLRRVFYAAFSTPWLPAISIYDCRSFQFKVATFLGQLERVAVMGVYHVISPTQKEQHFSLWR